MTDRHTTVDAIRWFRVLPWLHLLRAAQVALRFRAVLLSLFAVSLMAWSQPLLATLFADGSQDARATIWQRLNSNDLAHSLDPRHPEGRGWMIWPWISALQPGWSLLFEGPHAWPKLATHWTNLLSSLLIWGVFGGAICRMHALRFAKDKGASPITVVRFTGRLWHCYLYAPLVPFLGVGLFWLMSFLVGQLDHWLSGGPGSVLFYLGWLPTLAGLAMSVLLILIAAGWPLMVAAISIEGSDGFDGFSRAFGYVMNRPWHFVFLVLMAAAVGLLTDYFAHALFGMTFELARISSGDRGFNASTIWRSFVTLLHLSVLASYFWSATTVIYFLLRLSDDGTPLDQVYVPGPPPVPEPLPLVGVAASNQPMTERPVMTPESAEDEAAKYSSRGQG